MKLVLFCFQASSISYKDANLFVLSAGTMASSGDSGLDTEGCLEAQGRQGRAASVVDLLIKGCLL